MMRRKQFCQILIVALLVSGVNFFSSTEVSAAGWGSVTGQFVYDGPLPEKAIERKKGDSSVKDAPVCAAKDHFNNDLVINPENKGIQNIFMYLKRARKVHPDLKSSKEKKVVFDQKGCTFKPHALVVRTDQKVNVKSDDGVAHNTHTNPILNDAVNFILAPNDRVGVDVENLIGEPLPTKVVCDIHPFMTAYWLILDHPYGVVSDKDGKFTIENLPAGTHKFIVWQERPGFVNRRFEVTIKDGETVDLGQIKIKPAKLKSK